MQLQCWVKLLWDQASKIFHIYQPLWRHNSCFFLHTSWNESVLIPLCFISVQGRLNLSIKDLRNFFHRNPTAACLRDEYLPTWAWRASPGFGQLGTGFFQQSLCVWLDAAHYCSVKLSFNYISDSLIKEHETIKTWFFSPRNLDHANCLVKLYLSWKILS